MQKGLLTMLVLCIPLCALIIPCWLPCKRMALVNHNEQEACIAVRYIESIHCNLATLLKGNKNCVIKLTLGLDL